MSDEAEPPAVSASCTSDRSDISEPALSVVPVLVCSDETDADEEDTEGDTGGVGVCVFRSHPARKANASTVMMVFEMFSRFMVGRFPSLFLMTTLCLMVLYHIPDERSAVIQPAVIHQAPSGKASEDPLQACMPLTRLFGGFHGAIHRSYEAVFPVHTFAYQVEVIGQLIIYPVNERRKKEIVISTIL